MLTIQPKLTHISSKTAFKGDENFDRRAYENEKSYYQSKAREFNEIEKDEDLPKVAKKGAKFFRIISEAVVKGLAVAWATTTSAALLKKIKSDKISKWVNDVVKPTGEKLKNATTVGIANIKNSKFATKIAEKFSRFVEKMDNNKFGHYIVSGFRYIGKGVKAVGRFIKKAFNIITKPFRKTTYDKAVKTTSTTLGVGSGAAAAYEEARTPRKPVEHTEYQPELPFEEGDE